MNASKAVFTPSSPRLNPNEAFKDHSDRPAPQAAPNSSTLTDAAKSLAQAMDGLQTRDDLAASALTQFAQICGHAKRQVLPIRDWLMLRGVCTALRESISPNPSPAFEQLATVLSKGHSLSELPSSSEYIAQFKTLMRGSDPEPVLLKVEALLIGQLEQVYHAMCASTKKPEADCAERFLSEALEELNRLEFSLYAWSKQRMGKLAYLLAHTLGEHRGLDAAFIAVNNSYLCLLQFEIEGKFIQGLKTTAPYMAHRLLSSSLKKTEYIQALPEALRDNPELAVVAMIYRHDFLSLFSQRCQNHPLVQDVIQMMKNPRSTPTLQPKHLFVALKLGTHSYAFVERLIMQADLSSESFRDLAMMALKIYPYLIKRLPSRLRRDPELLRVLLRTEPKYITEVPQDLPEFRSLALVAVSRRGLNLEYLPDCLRADPEMCRAALNENSFASKYVLTGTLI